MQMVISSAGVAAESASRSRPLTYGVPMASIEATPEAVHVRLSRWERIGSLHADLHIPIEHIVSSDVGDDPCPILRGWRAPGTGIPYVTMLETMRSHGLKDFCAIYKRRPARVIECNGFTFARVIVTLPAVGNPAPSPS